jgi:hypothetical protein
MPPVPMTAIFNRSFAPNTLAQLAAGLVNTTDAAAVV